MHEDQRVLVKQEQIKKRWKIYFDKLFNGTDTKDWSESINLIEDRNLKDVLRRMKWESHGTG